MNHLLIALCAFLLAGCSSGGGNAPDDSRGDGSGAVDGRVYDQTLSSNVDGEDIVFTVFEPSRIVPGETYPLIVHSHGYGGSRITSPNAFVTRLRDAGYAVLSLDERGFGESGGEVMALDPDFEGRDWVQVLDWAEAEMPWLRYAQGNLVLGAYGSSYGGGFQHLVLAVDPKQRLDAIVPDITWHELLYAFYPNAVFKTSWLTLLEAAGTAGSGGRQADFINQAYVTGTTTNNVPEDQHGPFKRNGMSNYCASGMVPRVDALYWQGLRDQLFNFNEAYWNYRCLDALGGDVRLMTHQSGHILPGVQADGPYSCGGIGFDDASFAWFEDKLQGKSGAADFLPSVCLSLDADNGREMNAVPLGDVLFPIPETSLLVGPSAEFAGATAIDFGAVDEASLIAGMIPAQLVISDPSGLNLGDPRVFVGIGVQRGGSGNWELVDDQVYPFRGFGTDDDYLVGVAEGLSAGDHFGLLLFGFHDTYFGNGSREDILVTVSGSVSLPLQADPAVR